MSGKSMPVRQHYVPPMAKYKGINADLKHIPRAKVRSSNRCYCDRERCKVASIVLGSIACALIIMASFAVPIALVIVLNKDTTTTSTQSTASTTVNANSTSSITTSMNISYTTNPTTYPATTSLCPNMTCKFNPKITLMQYNYGVEQLNINCTQTLISMFIQIIVQKLVNATYANEYKTFWTLTTNQTYTETNSEIIYTWTLLPGQIIDGTGFPYYVEAQYNLYGVNQTTSLDTYSATFTSTCGTIISTNGTF